MKKILGKIKGSDLTESNFDAVIARVLAAYNEVVEGEFKELMKCATVGAVVGSFVLIICACVHIIGTKAWGIIILEYPILKV